MTNAVILTQSNVVCDQKAKNKPLMQAITMILLAGSALTASQTAMAGFYEAIGGYNSAILSWERGGIEQYGLCFKETNDPSGKCDDSPLKVDPKIKFSGNGMVSGGPAGAYCGILSDKVYCLVKGLKLNTDYKFAAYIRKEKKIFGIKYKVWEQVDKNRSVRTGSNPPTTQIKSSVTSTCAGQPVTLNLFFNSTATIPTYVLGNGFGFTVANASSGTATPVTNTNGSYVAKYSITVNPTATTTYTVSSVTDPLLSTASGDNVTVNVNPLPILGQFKLPENQKLFEKLVFSDDLPYDLTQHNPPLVSGSAGGTYTWYAGTQTAPSSTVIPDGKAGSFGSYWVKYTDKNGCASSNIVGPFTLYIVPAKTGLSMGLYCVDGTANNVGYSWRLDGIDGNNNITPIAQNLSALPVPTGGPTELVSAFTASINTAIGSPPNPAIAEEGPFPGCFGVSKTPYLSFNLSVGRQYVQPDCTITPTNACSYNPTAIKVQTKCVIPVKDIGVWYSFDNSTWNKTGKVTGNLITAPGKVMNALSFDGKSYLDIPNSTGINPGSGNFSVSMWVKTTQQSLAYLLGKENLDATSAQGYAIYLNQGKVGIHLANGKGSKICSPQPSASCTNYDTGKFVADGQWHLLTVIVDRLMNGIAMHGVQLYVDGQAVTNFNNVPRTGSLDNNMPLKLGSSPASSTTPIAAYQGLLDEVSFFKRSLQANEVKMLYMMSNQNSGMCVEDKKSSPTSGPVAIIGIL